MKRIGKFIKHARSLYDKAKPYLSSPTIQQYLYPALNRGASYAIDTLSRLPIGEDIKEAVIDKGLKTINSLLDDNDYGSTRPYFKKHGLNPNSTTNMDANGVWNPYYQAMRERRAMDSYRSLKPQGGDAAFGIGYKGSKDRAKGFIGDITPTQKYYLNRLKREMADEEQDSQLAQLQNETRDIKIEKKAVKALQKDIKAEKKAVKELKKDIKEKSAKTKKKATTSKKKVSKITI